MNTLIKSLANVWANRRREDPELGIVYVFTEPALQAFAEKIVKECARISEECDDTMTNQGAASAQAFMEHFGVE